MTFTALSEPALTQADFTYQSVFKSWDKKSSVRSYSNHHDYDWALHSGYLWMPVTDDSILVHPSIIDAMKPKLSAYLLIGNLDYTYSLEQCLIAQVSADMASGHLLKHFPQAVKVDALKVQCDEAYHALQAFWLSECVRAAENIEGDINLESHFLTFVDDVSNHSDQVSADIVRFCAVAVSELLITKSLRYDWRNSSMPKPIGEFFFEHHKDEARHAVYYLWLLENLWPQWSTSIQNRLTKLWAEFIDAYLDSEIHTARHALRQCQFSESEIQQIIQDTYYKTQSPYQNQRKASLEHATKVFNRVSHNL